MKKIIKISLITALALCLAFAGIVSAYADDATDEILLYEITADVQDDASVMFDVHIQWKVLESDSIGPVEWLTIGVPNGHCDSPQALSDNISEISYISSDKVIRVDFDKAYYEGEVIDFEYTVRADYMYQMNASQTGYTVYYYTPGWFDGVAVDQLILNWSADKADSWTGGALQKGDYLVWETSLAAGATFRIEVSYPNDAYSFIIPDTSSTNNSGYQEYDSGFNVGALLVIVFPIAFVVIGVIIMARQSKKNYNSSSGFAGGETKTKVTRTKVVYYDACPGCGAPREEGKEICQYCGRSLIKSEEVVKEEEIPDEDKDKYDEKGLYHFGSDPNTFMRVNVVHVPIVTPGIMHHSTPGGIHHGSGGGCAHSSCACVSCACACACACAGGGRAGCTTKDFYSTKLKLTQIERKNKTK